MSASPQHVSIAIVGAGFAGLGAAIQLERAGFEDLIVLERWAFAHVPGARKLVRAGLCARRERMVPAFRHPSLMRLVEPLAKHYLRRVVKDPALRAKPSLTEGRDRGRSRP